MYKVPMVSVFKATKTNLMKIKKITVRNIMKKKLDPISTKTRRRWALKSIVLLISDI
jgi:hypothetical protein